MAAAKCGNRIWHTGTGLQCRLSGVLTMQSNVTNSVMWLWSIYNCLITGYKHIEYNYSIEIMSFYEKKNYSDKIIQRSHFMTVSYLFPSCVFNINHSNIIEVLYIKIFNKTRITIFHLLLFSGSQTERHMQCPKNKSKKQRISWLLLIANYIFRQNAKQ